MKIETEDYLKDEVLDLKPLQGQMKTDEEIENDTAVLNGIIREILPKSFNLSETVVDEVMRRLTMEQKRRIRKQEEKLKRKWENMIGATAREFLDFLTNQIHDFGNNDDDDDDYDESDDNSSKPRKRRQDDDSSISDLSDSS